MHRVLQSGSDDGGRRMHGTIQLPDPQGRGFIVLDRIHRNLSTATLYEEVTRLGEGCISRSGALVVRTGAHTGRSPNDKFIVREPSSEKNIWWGKINRAFGESNFSQLHNRLLAYLQGKDIFIQDCYAGADPKYQISVRVITETAWHSIFAKNMFLFVKYIYIFDKIDRWTKE